jgi:hypothetical protein
MARSPSTAVASSIETLLSPQASVPSECGYPELRRLFGEDQEGELESFGEADVLGSVAAALAARRFLVSSPRRKRPYAEPLEVMRMQNEVPHVKSVGWRTHILTCAK